jgi:hypothetical protein
MARVTTALMPVRSNTLAPISQAMCRAKVSAGSSRRQQTVVKLRSKRGVSPHGQLASRNLL